MKKLNSFYFIIILLSISAVNAKYLTVHSAYQSIAVTTTPAMSGCMERMIDKPIRIARITAEYNYNRSKAKVTTALNATTYYVDQQNGSDTNNGTSVATAFKNFDTAKNAVQPGDTIIIVGTYHNPSYDPNYTYNAPNDAHLWHAENTLQINGLNGTANAYITIKSYDPNTKILGDGANIVRIQNCSYLRIEDLNIEGEVERIPLSTALALQFVYIIDDNTLTGTVTHPNANDIHHRNEEDNDGDHIVEETDTYTDISNLRVKRPSYTDTRGLYVSNCEHLDLIKNTIHHTPGGGLRVSDSKFVTISANEIYHCSARSYSGTHALVVTKTKPIIGNNGNSIVIEKNLVHHNYNEIFSWSPKKTIITPRIDEGKGISLQRNNTDDWKNGQGRILVANNICYWNGFSGAHSNDGYRIDFINNTCFMNSYTNTVTYANTTQQGQNIGVSTQRGHDIRMINNISVVDASWGGFALSASNSSNIEFKNNLIYGVNGTLAHDNDVNNQNGIEQDPLFTDAPTTYQDETYAFDFKILSTSPAIDQGNTGNYVPDDDYYNNQRDNSPDIGAIERAGKCDINYVTEWKMTNGVPGWTNGTPNDTKPAVFSTSYIVNSNDLTACAMTINQGVTVTVYNNHFVKIKTDLINNGEIKVRNKGAFVQTDDNSSISGTGTFQLNKTSLPLNNYWEYVYWSSPINSSSFTLGDIVSNAWRYYKYDPNEANNGYTYPGWVMLSASYKPQAGVGYAISAPNGVSANTNLNVQFKKDHDPFNNGEIQVPILKKSGPDNLGALNLIGNPYPSAIDFDALYNDNQSAINGTYYLWTNCAGLDTNGHHQDSGYTTYTYSNGNGTATAACNGTSNQGGTASRYIATGQGFFVEAKADNQTLTFKNAHRVTGHNNNFLNRPNNPDRDIVWLDMTNDTGKFSQIAVGFYPGATANYDAMFDAHSLNAGSGFSLYSLVGHDKLVIQGLSPDNIERTIVPLGVEVSSGENITLQINRLERFDAYDIYLVDNLTGTYHNLKTSPYTLSLDAGVYEERFVLRFARVLNTDEQTVSFSLILSQHNGLFRLWHSGDENIQKIAVYNLSGQLIYENNSVNKSEVEIDLHNIATGNLLVFKVTDDKGRTAVKKAVKR